jgi:hypothetical protein
VNNLEELDNYCNNIETRFSRHCWILIIDPSISIVDVIEVMKTYGKVCLVEDGEIISLERVKPDKLMMLAYDFDEPVHNNEQADFLDSFEEDKSVLYYYDPRKDPEMKDRLHRYGL